MKNRIIFISEALAAPFDEGIKNIAISLYEQLMIRGNSLTVTKAGNDTKHYEITKVRLNKLLLIRGLRKILVNYTPDIILYLPEASITLNSFLRAKTLSFMCNSAKIAVLGVQHREYSFIERIVISRLLKPDILLLLKKSNKDFLSIDGVNIKVLPPAVDTVKFYPATLEEKRAIRAEYKIPDNKTVVLHVGHIKDERNIECLLEIQKIQNLQVVIVGSTTTVVDKSLRDSLVKVGVHIIDEFIPDISKVYKMSDIYVFPVIKNTAAIDMPLSVLEAMACNLPVITTRFGGLVDFFKEDSGFRYFDTTEKLVELIKDIDNVEVHNNKKIEHFTWNRFADEILTACNELMADSS